MSAMECCTEEKEHEIWNYGRMEHGGWEYLQQRWIKYTLHIPIMFNILSLTFNVFLF